MRMVGTSRIRWWATFVGGAVGLSVPGRPGEAQVSVSLRSSVTLDWGTPVLLRDVADLTGPDAERFGALVLSPAGVAGSETVEIDSVRSAIGSAGKINWGTIALRGSGCVVRRRAEVTTEPPTATPREKAVIPQAGTVRGLVVRRVAESLGVPEDDLRLTFDDRDSALLDRSVEGLIADVQMMGLSERQPVSVRLYSGDATVAGGRVRVEVLVRREAAVCARAARRGEVLDSSSIVTEERWVPPTVRAAGASTVIGQSARGRLSVGQVIETDDVEPPLCIKKGDLVDAVCLSGGISVKVKARAQEPGRRGQVIALRVLDATRSFSARVDGPGRVIAGPGAGSEFEPAAYQRAEVPPADAESGGPGPGRDDSKRRLKFLDLGDRAVNADRADPGQARNK